MPNLITMSSTREIRQQMLKCHVTNLKAQKRWNFFVVVKNAVFMSGLVEFLPNVLWGRPRCHHTAKKTHATRIDHISYFNDLLDSVNPMTFRSPFFVFFQTYLNLRLLTNAKMCTYLISKRAKKNTSRSADLRDCQIC